MRNSPSSLPMTSTQTLTKDTKLSTPTVFASSTTNEIADDFYFDTVTLRAGFSSTAIIVTSSSSPTSSASPGPDLGTTTLSHSHSFRHSANYLSLQETHSFMQKLQPTKTSQQRFLSSNAIESAVTDKAHFDTVIFASHLTSIGSMVSLSSARGLFTTGGLSTTPMSPNYPSRHTEKTQTSTTSTRLQGMFSFTQNIQTTKTSQQRLSSNNVSGFDVSDDFYFNTVLLITRFASKVSIVSLSSRRALSTSGRFQLISTSFPQSYYFRHTANAFTTLTGSRGITYLTQNIQATKASQQRILSSNTIGSEVSVDVYSNKVMPSSHFTTAHAVSTVILSSSPSFFPSDGLFLSGNKSSVTKVSETDRGETHTIQPTKTSQQRMFSSHATTFKGN